jgi:hypothetical protein
MLFFNNYFGLIIDNTSGTMLHFNGDYRLDFRNVLNYDYINTNKNKLKQI